MGFEKTVHKGVIVSQYYPKKTNISNETISKEIQVDNLLEKKKLSILISRKK